MCEVTRPAQWEAEDEQEAVAQLHLLWRFYYEPRAATMELFPGEQSGLMAEVAHARRIAAKALGTADPLYVLLDTALRINALPALRGALQTFAGQPSPLLTDDHSPPHCLPIHPRRADTRSDSSTAHGAGNCIEKCEEREMSGAGSVTILLVDDDALFVGSVAETLQTADYTVETAASGHEAFAAMRTCRPSLIMLNIALPDIAGTDFCHIVRQRLGSVPIILLTMRGVTRNAISALDAGADDCINKSCDARELLARVRAVLRRAPTIRPLFQG